MSINLEVFLKRDNMPSRDKWQKEITALGVNLQLAESDPLTHQGFWPCKLDGIDCGFEYFFGAIDPIANDNPPLPSRRGWWARIFGLSNHAKSDEREEPDELQVAIGDRDSVVNFKWHGGHHEAMNDGRAANLAAASLAKIANGTFLDTSGNFAVGAEALNLIGDDEN